MGNDEREITFRANCQVCGRKDIDCRNHHLVPQRLIKTLLPKFQKRWQFMKVVCCDNCNGFFHPENHLYKRILYLEAKIRELEGKNEQ